MGNKIFLGGDKIFLGGLKIFREAKFLGRLKICGG